MSISEARKHFETNGMPESNKAILNFVNSPLFRRMATPNKTSAKFAAAVSAVTAIGIFSLAEMYIPTQGIKAVMATGPEALGTGVGAGLLARVAFGINNLCLEKSYLSRREKLLQLTSAGKSISDLTTDDFKPVRSSAKKLGSKVSSALVKAMPGGKSITESERIEPTFGDQ